MLVIPILLCLQTTAVSGVDTVRLAYDGWNFVATGSNWTERVPVSTATLPPAKTFEFSDGELSIKFDGKQMTITLGKYTRSTRFPDIPTSPRLFSKEQIRDAIQGIEAGSRAREVSALSGYELLGDQMYLLLRWDDEDRKPIFEALVSIDLAEAIPWFKVVDKMPGVSTATGSISDELLVVNGRLATVAKNSEKWGLATWDLDKKYTRFYPIGSGLMRYSIPSQAPSKLLFVERTSYGSWLAGRVDLATNEREDLAEDRDKVSFVATDPTVLRFDSEQGCRIRYLASGLESSFPAWTAARDTPHGLITWYPSTKPTTATWYAKGTWTPVARWTQPPPAKPPAPKPSPAKP